MKYGSTQVFDPQKKKDASNARHRGRNPDILTWG
jgi:hypothetical protein